MRVLYERSEEAANPGSSGHLRTFWRDIMNRKVLGAILIIVIGMVCAGIVKGYIWWSEKNAEVASSDAGSRSAAKIRIGGDPYLGYFFFRSPQMKKEALKRGLAVDFTDDGGDYAARLEKFNKGEYDAIVLPINSYLEHGAKYKYPGVIVGSIAESKGADAVACFEDKLPTGKVTDLNDASLKIVYTGESPSSFLLDLAISDFDLFNLKKVDTWRVEVAGSDKVYEKAKHHEGDCFVMWEPDVSRALRDIPGLKKVWGSEKFSGYIVDVFVFRRDFVSKRPDDLTAFFDSYFMSMRSYASDRSRMADDMKSVFGLQKPELEQILADKEIHWYDLNENLTRQFGVVTADGSHGVEGVVNTIVSSTDVLVRNGRLAKDPLDGDPYKIINSQVLQTVLTHLPKEVGAAAENREFTELSDADWASLEDPKNGHEIGVMRVEPITFQSGSAKLSTAGETQVDKIAELLVNNYPDYRIVVRGHTARGADEEANIRLSQDRAEAVKQRLIAVRGISPNRVKAEGIGSSQPPQKRPDENQRQYQYRIPRVEFTLFEDPNKSF
jgi:outer membrane protein OmpA-like peptidoglycan-associated protein